MTSKNWASKAWEKVNQESLTKLGYPNVNKLIEAARKDRKKVMSKLNFLANASGDAATKAKAKMIMEKIKKALGD